MVYVGLAFVVIWVIFQFAKNLNDPDVREASDLRMSVNHYKIYKQMQEELSVLYDKNASSREIDAIINRAPDLNEWRRFSDRQFQKQREKMNDMINKLK